jgi:hypothetical protein
VLCGLHYKPITIVNDDSSIINKLEISLIDDARVITYNCQKFKVQARGVFTAVVNMCKEGQS